MYYCPLILEIEKLANTERHLDISKGHVNRVEDKQDELKQLNRSIFRPVITFNKDAKRAAQEAKHLRRHEEERDDHEKAMMDIRETQNRVGKAQTYGRGGDDDDDDDEGIGGYGSGRFKAPVDQTKRKEERKRYQFEATASDDELEDELDDNLGEIGDVAKKLKALGTAMGQELDSQNARLDKLDRKTGNLDDKLFKGTRRVRPFVSTLASHTHQLRYSLRRSSRVCLPFIPSFCHQCTDNHSGFMH